MGNLTDAMLAYAKVERDEVVQALTSTPEHYPDAGTCSAGSLKAGFQGLSDILHRLNRGMNGGTALENVGEEPVEISMEDRDAGDRTRVEAEINRYLGLELTAEERNDKKFNMLKWWKRNRHKCPLLWKVARDVLPAQASSVPCERVFSAAKHTTTQQRNGLRPELIEKLQIMKFYLKQERLDHTADWLWRAEDMIGAHDYS
jgi:hypothetical protein